MARAETPSLLPIDSWAKILGINPLFINGVSSEYLSTFHGCGDVVPQAAWQRGDQIGRDDIAEAIASAESAIADIIGARVAPAWEVGELASFTRPADRGLFHGGMYNIRSISRSVQTRFGHYLMGGRKSKSLILANRPIAYSDGDGDNYDETATITAVTTITDANEIGLFYPGEIGADAWEIRPITVTIAGGTATIRFRREQVPLPDLQTGLSVDPIDGDVDANFLTAADVYRVYNDPSVQAQMQWEPSSLCGCEGSICAACQYGTQDGCLLGRDHRLGIVTVQPGTWNADDAAFDSAALAYERGPERVKLWYRAGWQDESLARSYVEMDRRLAWMVAILSVSQLGRTICSCDSVRSWMAHWQQDLSEEADGGNRYKMSNRLLDCPLGTTRGAIEVWKRLQQGNWMIGRVAG